MTSPVLAIFSYIIRRDKVTKMTNIEMPFFRWSSNCTDFRLMINICARLESCARLDD